MNETFKYNIGEDATRIYKSPVKGKLPEKGGRKATGPTGIDLWLPAAKSPLTSRPRRSPVGWRGFVY